MPAPGLMRWEIPLRAKGTRISAPLGVKFCKNIFLGYRKYPSMRNSLKAIASTCRSLQKEKETTSNVNFYTEIGQSQWLQHIFGVLKGATKVWNLCKVGILA